MSITPITTPLGATPPMGEVVTDKVLAMWGMSGVGISLSKGFGGTTDPTVIWQNLITDHQMAYPYLRELEEKDEDIGYLIETLKLMVSSCEMEIRPFDDTAAAKSVADFVKQVI